MSDDGDGGDTAIPQAIRPCPAALVAGGDIAQAHRSRTTHTAVVSEQYNNTRLPRFMRHAFADIITSKSQAHAAFTQGIVLVNGKAPTSEARLLKTGDAVTILDRTCDDVRRDQEFMDLQVLYEDDDIAVVWKPSGVTVSRFDAKTLETALRHILQPVPSQYPRAALAMPSCIVSLDKATPGLVLCLKTQEAETAVRQMVADGLVEFRWTALCLGDLSAHPLVQTGDHPTSFIVSEPLDGVAAATKCAIIATVPTRNHPSGYLTLVELTPQNGMLPQTKYQVRLHLECLGHSVIGNGKHTADFRTARGKGIFLALVGVSLQHPFTQQRLDVEHGPPAKFEALCSREEQTVRKKRELELEELKQHREQLEAQGLSISSEHPTLHSNGISEVPLAYITGTKRFFRHNFHVNSSVLIPRQGTETLVQASIELLQPRSDAGQSVRVLDLGTGSGCLLISILASLAGSVGVGLDISPEALDIAQRNAQDNGVASRARFAVGTFERIYESLEPDGAQNPMPFDLVVCNPPYLSHRKARLLEGRTLNAEPAEALVSGATGMEAYEAIIAGLDALHRNSGLSSDAILVLEIGHGMAHDVGALFSRTPIWLLTECRTDANGLDRCLVYRLMPSNLCL